MNEVIDLYAKLLIGTFSVIGPSFSLLVPIFYPAFVQSRQCHMEIYDNLSRVFNRFDRAGTFADMEKSGRRIKKLLEENQKDIRLLNPKRQGKRLFTSLLSAIVLVIFYYFQRSDFWPYQYQIVRVCTLLLSTVNFGFSLLVLWQIFCMVVKIKQEEKEAFLIKLKSIGYG